MAAIADLLTDIALGVIDRNCVLVIKNLQSSVTDGTLVNWVEVVTDEEVKDDVCHYHRPLTSVSIAVLNSSIQDQMDRIQKTVLTKTLGQRVLDVSLIGLPAGLLLQNEQGHAHSVDSLELFFENARNGGEEDSVQSVMHKESGITLIPFFSGSLPTAVENILRKGRQSGHVLNNKPLTAVPYYPIFHDYVLDQLCSTETRKLNNTQSQSEKTSDGQDRQDSNPHGNIHDDSALMCFSSEEDDNNSNVMVDGVGDIDLSGSKRGQGQTIQGERDQSEIFACEDDSKLLTQSPSNSEKVPLEDYIRPWEVKSDRQEIVDQAGNLIFIGYDLPAVDKTRKQPGLGKALNIQTADEQDQHLTKAPTETKVIHLPKHKIILLRISSFGRKKKNVEIDLNSEKGHVRITGMREDIRTVTDEMLNKLKEIQQNERKVSNEVAALLEHKMRTPDFTKQTLMGDKIYAHATCEAKENSVRAYAFNREHAKRAVDKMLSLVDSVDITYTECHFKYLASSNWQNLVQKWESLGLVKIKVMKPEKNIRITSVISPSDVVRDIEGELGKFSDVTGKPISVDGGKGLMLHYCLQDKMRQMESDVRHAGGQMDHGLKAGTYIVTVQGNPSLVKKTESQLHSLTYSIWEGNVDLSRLEGKSRPLTEEEKAITIEGISSKKGKDFLKRFSIEHSCIVLFTPKSGARPRFKEPNGMIRSHSLPVLEPPTGRLHNRYSRTGQTEDSHLAKRNPYQPRYRSREPSHREDREGHTHRNSEDFSNYRKPERQPGPTKSIKVRNCTITVKKGSITEEMANILVNVVGESRKLTESFISRKFVECGGPTLEKLFRNVDGGSAVFTPGVGALLCQNVCHVVLRRWQVDQKTKLQKELRSTLQEIFTEAKNLKATKIAFPALGTGRLLGYPVPFMADCLVSEAVTACKQDTSLTDVVFVIYDEQQLDVFIKQLGREEDQGRSSFQRPSYQPQAPVSRQEVTSAVRSRSDTLPAGSMTLFCTPKEKGEELRSTLSADLRKHFLAKEKIPFHSDKVDKKSIFQLCTGKSVEVNFEQAKKKIIVFGEKEAVHSVTKKVYRILHESLVEKAPEKYTPPKKDTHGTPRYWKELYENPPVPQYWKHFKNGYGLMDYLRIVFQQPNRTEIISVDPTTFGFVKSLVERSFDKNLVGKGKDAQGLAHTQIIVRKVERIENYSLYEAYSLERRKFFKHKGNGKSQCLALETIPQQTKGPIITTRHINSHLLSDMFKDINEHYFFHGTDDERIKRIAESGLDPRYGGKGMFGQGIYGAECSTKADQYADTAATRHARGSRKMLMIRLLLGDTFVTSTAEQYSLPPCKTCNKPKCVAHGHTYDSVVADGRWLFREFVVYDKNQCYPEYIITYDRQ